MGFLGSGRFESFYLFLSKYRIPFSSFPKTAIFPTKMTRFTSSKGFYFTHFWLSCLSGKEHRFSLLALTGHSVGDSKPSNAVYVHSPSPPISPQIYRKDSATAGSIGIAWKQAEPASTNIPEEHAQCSYSVFVDDILHGEYPLDGMNDIFSDEHTYTISNLEVDRMYKVCVKCYLNPRVIDSGRGPNLYVCGCYGDSSNVLELFCAAPPSPPIVRISRIDQSGVTLSWSRSREYGGVTLGVCYYSAVNAFVLKSYREWNFSGIMLLWFGNIGFMWP